MWLKSMSTSNSVELVIPFFNEEKRFNLAYLSDLAKVGNQELNFENDGSSDGTINYLIKIQKNYPNIMLINLPINRGKAEAVRVGLQQFIKYKPNLIFWILGLGWCDFVR